MRSICDIWASC